GNTADIRTFRARVAEGSVTAEGRASLDGPGSMRIAWERLDLDALLRDVLGNAPKVIPASQTSGTLDAKWTAPRVERVELTGEAQLVASDSGRTAREGSSRATG